MIQMNLSKVTTYIGMETVCLVPFSVLNFQELCAEGEQGFCTLVKELKTHNKLFKVVQKTKKKLLPLLKQHFDLVINSCLHGQIF